MSLTEHSHGSWQCHECWQTPEPGTSVRRIQRKRVKGWRMPQGAVYVGRPTRWGNPFVVDQCRPEAELGWAVFTEGSALMRPDTFRATRREATELAVEAFSLWLRSDRERVMAAQVELAGKDLACWCPEGQPCHADVLLDLANRPPVAPPARSGIRSPVVGN